VPIHETFMLGAHVVLGELGLPVSSDDLAGDHEPFVTHCCRFADRAKLVDRQTRTIRPHFGTSWGTRA